MANKAYSAKELSKICGVSQVTIVRITKGTQEARPGTVGKIAKALDAKKVEVRKFSNKKINKNDIRVVDEWGGTFKFWDFETLSKYNYELKIKK